MCSFCHLFHPILSTSSHRPVPELSRGFTARLFLFASSSVFHLSFCCLWYVSGASKKSDIYARAWSKVRYNSAADRLKKGKEELCCNMTAPSLPHPTAQSKDTEQEEWWGDFSLRFLCTSILSHLFIQNLVWA